MIGINPQLDTAYCIVCHRKYLSCNCEQQIKKFGIKAVKEYDRQIKSGKKYWGYQQFFHGVLGLKE